MIHIVDTSSWEYLKKSDETVTNNGKTYIDPIVTKEFDFKFHK